MRELCQTAHQLQLASHPKSVLGIFPTVEREQSPLTHGR
jgi:hypothetical protein